ncbi:MAG: 1-acyl-sn-glycerol-3-phosphate acyltransferase [Clostridia bacterium]|nr:1-acyl-sn-glycerol-3-phosphate acyltransferase [Clostridia bacterium]
MNNEKIRYYTDFSDDFFQVGEEYTLPKDYKWNRTDAKSRFLSGMIYTLALLFSNIYCRLFLHLRIKGAKKVRKQKGGFFLYGNHTQPIGDVFHPALACFPKRIYTVVSAANMYLPVIGKILPYLGALPIPDTLQGMKTFAGAIEQRIQSGHPVIIYPEAHLWEYYTDIRPFSETSFKYPVNLNVPVYSMTTTYQERKPGKRPSITLYIDGPFQAVGTNKKEKAIRLRDRVYAQMKERAKSSNCNYIVYKQK